MKVCIFKNDFLGQYMGECALVNPNRWQIIGEKNDAKLVPFYLGNWLLHEISIFILKVRGKSLNFIWKKLKMIVSIMEFFFLIYIFFHVDNTNNSYKSYTFNLGKKSAPLREGVCFSLGEKLKPLGGAIWS